MNLLALREFEKAHPTRIHQSLPRNEDPTGDALDSTRMSSFCQISPQARHGQCIFDWCKCPCHSDEETLALMYGYGM